MWEVVRAGEGVGRGCDWDSVGMGVLVEGVGDGVEVGQREVGGCAS